MTARLFDLRIWFVAMVLLGGVGLVLAAQGAGRYNMHASILQDFNNTSNYPKCDSGNNFFLTMFFEWAHEGRMIAGQDCRIGMISAEEVAKRVEQYFLDRDIDPASASEQEILAAKDEVLLEWAGKIMGR